MTIAMLLTNTLHYQSRKRDLLNFHYICRRYVGFLLTSINKFFKTIMEGTVKWFNGSKGYGFYRRIRRN